MDRGFLRKAIELGKTASADLNHGEGVGSEANAQDFIDHYLRLVVELSVEFSGVKEKLIDKFPNLNKN